MEILLIGICVWFILFSLFNETIAAFNEWIEEQTRKQHLENIALERQIYGNENDH